MFILKALRSYSSFSQEPPDSSAASVAETVSERPNSSPPIPTIAPKLESSLPTLISPPKEQFEGTIRQDVTGEARREKEQTRVLDEFGRD